jgi:hypothetical protein
MGFPDGFTRNRLDTASLVGVVLSLFRRHDYSQRRQRCRDYNMGPFSGALAVPKTAVTVATLVK